MLMHRSTPQADSTWRELMEAAAANPNVLALAQDAQHLARVQEACALLRDVEQVRRLSVGATAGG